MIEIHYLIMRLSTFLFILSISAVAAWDDDDFEVFDVVEEVNQNFYELMGISQDATKEEIKTAFKKLTLKLHPDKNSSPDADVQFRNLVSVHNILKDFGKREKYNEVLKNGLPNWRSAVYYYRHVRKMGLAEGSFILFIIISFGQYAVSWASYLEQKYTAEQLYNSSKSKKAKKAGVDTGTPDLYQHLPRPSIKNTLPFQIPRLLWNTVIGLPMAIITMLRTVKEQKEERIRQMKKDEEDKLKAEREALEAERYKAEKIASRARRRRGFIPQERDCMLDPVDEPEDNEEHPVPNPVKSPPVITGGLWTDDDLAELVRLVKKYPGGTTDRWERIAETMCRSVPEVTFMAAKLKDNCYKLPGHDANEIPEPEPPKKVKTRKNEDVNSGGNWSQQQQKALETALAKYPKGGSTDRWEKISNAVPGKTKEECMLRCKYLSDLVKKQKQKDEGQSEGPAVQQTPEDEG